MNSNPIGIYDSGVGATAVLRTCAAILPDEDFILYADFKHAPYGQKTKQEILEHAKASVEILLAQRAKAVVVACNTATSAAVSELRNQFDIPIIGMEPAVKPAAETVKEGKIMVFATPSTLRFMKFKKLSESFEGRDIVPIECPGLAKLIEDEEAGSLKIMDYLEDILSKYNKEEIAAAVIGCTHYSYIEQEIKNATGCDKVFDGRYGTARRLKCLLDEGGLLGGGSADTTFIISGEMIQNEQLLKSFMIRPLSFEG